MLCFASTSAEEKDLAGGKVGGVEIVGIAAAVPEAVRTLQETEQVFGDAATRRVLKNRGVQQIHVSTGGICASDLCYEAAAKLLRQLAWSPDSVDVLVFVSLTPDYITPATACVLQHRLQLPTSSATFDINHGCSGYVYGLWVVANLLSTGNARRALLLAGDTLSRLTSPYDQTAACLFGDAGSATALERCESAESMYFEMGSDGENASQIMVKAGGFRHPSTPETKMRTERESGNVRSDEDIYLNGPPVFAISLRELPQLGERLLKRADCTFNDVDAVVMAQANLFIIRYLAEKIGIPEGKLVENLTNYGDTGSATIPLAISQKLGERLQQDPMRLLLLGFGTGLSWAAASIRCGPLAIPPLTVVQSGSAHAL